MIEAYLRNGCAEEAKALNDEITKTWYPPHHAVYKINAVGKLDCKSDHLEKAYYIEGAPPVSPDLACSPHLAINVNKAGAERNPTECDQLIQRPLSNKYIDDLVVSCDKESELMLLQKPAS
ncbi:hypothetical protein T4A_12629 [Trichinella pseudospiralis]|uniref:Uncharacterized protein n=1 Tax=Trichinella pseudospiralis TaxID=6337 RepID=A0A0V1ETB6_TRIPS|nr:hypothetical protein T4A_12629 [Trichinella pseudospiralis]KRZ45359.1 hypothetical protein T4C_4566 [Trichinella pseudospiralis]